MQFRKARFKVGADKTLFDLVEAQIGALSAAARGVVTATAQLDLKMMLSSTALSTASATAQLNLKMALSAAAVAAAAATSTITIGAETPAEVPWTSEMALPRFMVEMGPNWLLKADGAAAVTGERVQSLVSTVGGNAIAAANTAAAAADTNRGIAGPVTTIGSVTAPTLTMGSAGQTANRYLSPVGSFGMPSGSIGDIEVALVRVKPPASGTTAKTILSNSSGNFNSDVNISGPAGLGAVTLGTDTASPLKVDTTERYELYVLNKESAQGNSRAMRLNDVETPVSIATGASLALAAGRAVFGNIYGGSQGAEVTALLSWAIFPQGTTRANIHRHVGRIMHKFGLQGLLPANHPCKLAPPTVPPDVTSTAADRGASLAPAQTLSVGYGAEIQSDSFYGGAVPLPTDDWAYPRDFTTSEKARFKATFFPGGEYGYHFIRLPLDCFAHHREYAVDPSTGLRTKSAYLPGVLASIADMLANVMDAGGGVYPEHWGFPAWFKTESFGAGSSQYGYGTFWAGASYGRTVTLASIRTTDPTQWATQIGLITDYMLWIREFIHAAGVRYCGDGFFNEAGNGATAIYGTIRLDDEPTYALIIKRAIEKIRASTVLSTWKGQPNVAKFFINSWDGIFTADSRGFSLIADAEVLTTGKTAWLEIEGLIDHSITANGADGDSVKTKTAQILSRGKSFSQNEMEHFNQFTTVGNNDYRTRQWRAMNLTLKTANYLVVGGAVLDVPIIHFTKPMGQTDVDSNTEGYGLTQTRLPAPFAQPPYTPDDPHPEIAHGAWAEVPVNFLGVKPLLFVAKNSVIHKVEGTVAAGQQTFSWVSPSGKRGYLFVNRTAAAAPQSFSLRAIKSMRGRRFSYDGGEQELGTVNASRIVMALPAWSCEVWLEQ